MASAPIDNRQLLIQVDASVELLRKNLRDAEQSLGRFDRTATQSAQRFDRAMTQVNRSTGQLRAGQQQLAFQLGDIAAQFGSGTSAMQIFAQQSGQVVQAIGLMAGTSRGFIGFLAGPWGVALTAATTLLLTLTSRSNETGEAQTELAARVGSAASTMQSTFAGLAAAFDPLFDAIDRVEARLTGFLDFVAKDVQNDIALILRGLDAIGNAGLQVSDLVTGRRTDTFNLAGEFRAGIQRDQAAQVRRGQLDSADRRFQDRFGFGSRGLEGFLRDNRPARGGSRARPRSGGRAAAPASDPFGDFLRNVSQDNLSALGRAEFVDPDESLRRATQQLYRNMGLSPADDFQRIYSEAEERGEALHEARKQQLRERLDIEAANIRTLSDLYLSAFDGGTKAIWRNFKLLGTQIIAETLARFTIGQVTGKGGSLLDTLGSVSTAVFGGSFANGGNPPVGKVSLVGERGPELFVPKVPGTIIPNNRLGGTGAISVHVTPSPLFDVTVRDIATGQIIQAAPAIVQQSANATIRALNRPRLIPDV
jgi:hypothetical protein